MATEINQNTISNVIAQEKKEIQSNKQSTEVIRQPLKTPNTISPNKSGYISLNKKNPSSSALCEKKGSITETLGKNTKRSSELNKDKKDYQLRCQAIMNRIENLKKKEANINKKISIINKQKMASTKVQTEKMQRTQMLSEVRHDDEISVIEKKKRAHIEHEVEIKSLKESVINVKEQNKKQYLSRKKESQRANSQIIHYKKQVEENKKEVCNKIKESSVDRRKIKKTLKEREEERRNKAIEIKIKQDEEYTEALKRKLKELEKEEENAFVNLTNTGKRNEEILKSYNLTNPSSDFKPKSAKQKVNNRTKSACAATSPLTDTNITNAIQIQENPIEKKTDLNQLIAEEKKAINAPEIANQ